MHFQMNKVFIAPMRIGLINFESISYNMKQLIHVLSLQSKVYNQASVSKLFFISKNNVKDTNKIQFITMWVFLPAP